MIVAKTMRSFLQVYGITRRPCNAWQATSTYAKNLQFFCLNGNNCLLQDDQIEALYNVFPQYRYCSIKILFHKYIISYIFVHIPVYKINIYVISYFYVILVYYNINLYYKMLTYLYIYSLFNICKFYLIFCFTRVTWWHTVK